MKINFTGSFYCDKSCHFQCLIYVSMVYNVKKIIFLDLLEITKKKKRESRELNRT